MSRDAAGADELGELREGMVALLARMERVEEEASVDLSSLRLDVEKLLSKLERNVRGRRGAESAVMTFDRLLTLDKDFTVVAGQWATVRRSAGTAAATEIVSLADLQRKWREKWGPSVEYAWRVRARVEERATRVDVAARARSSGDVLPVGLVLDLRYGTDLPLARIAEFFDLSAAAVQGRVATFETEVAVEIALATAGASTPPDWRLESRHTEGDFELRATWGRTLVFEVVPAWPDRESGAGRPRESGALFRRASDEARVWAVVEFAGPRLIYVPDARVREFAKGSMVARNATIDQIVRLAPRLGFSTLQEVVDDATRDVAANEA